jgi:hypothetical protein
LHPRGHRLRLNDGSRGRCAGNALWSWHGRCTLAEMPPNPAGHNQSHQRQQPQETAAPPPLRTRQTVFRVAPHSPI